MIQNLPSHIHRPSYAEIDLRRIRENFRILRELMGEGTFLCPMVKANAYGHGDIEVSKALRSEGATHLGVGLIEEGVNLRESGDCDPILMFGMFEERSAQALIDYRLTPVISAWNELAVLDEILRKGPAAESGHRVTFKIHLKFNSGMNRLGFPPDQAQALRKWLSDHPQFELEGVCTHLLRGEDAGAPGGESESQFETFSEVLRHFKGLSVYIHSLNSSATLNLARRVMSGSPLGAGAFWPMGSRPGLSVYGIEPANVEGATLSLKPVMRLVSHLVAVHQLKKGDRVSYGATWRAPKNSVVGVVPLGYADGYFRSLSNRGFVLARGHRAQVAGTVCMDYFMIDLTSVAEKTGPFSIGEEIVLIGEQKGARVGAQDLAAICETIPYEILTRISDRVPRVYLDSDDGGER